ncbi:ATP-dependent Clp protease proteolytic subunit, partial [Bifidobacteriaceae bacterium NR015]
MASEEAKFVARAERLAGFGGVTSAQRIANRYVLPQFGEQTPYG